MLGYNNGFANGGGLDLCISNNCNMNQYSHSNLGHSYELPGDLKYESNEA